VDSQGFMRFVGAHVAGRETETADASHFMTEERVYEGRGRHNRSWQRREAFHLGHAVG